VIYGQTDSVVFNENEEFVSSFSIVVTLSFSTVLTFIVSTVVFPSCVTIDFSAAQSGVLPFGCRSEFDQFRAPSQNESE
jgi:hypothetical protein